MVELKYNNLSSRNLVYSNTPRCGLEIHKTLDCSVASLGDRSRAPVLSELNENVRILYPPGKRDTRNW